MTPASLKPAALAMFGKAHRFLVCACLLALCLSASSQTKSPSRPQPSTGTQAVDPSAIDIQANRINITPVSNDWRFNGGDDPRWADPAFDDSSWKMLQPARELTAQGFAPVNHLAWLRFRLKVPGDAQSLIFLMPGTTLAYQIFADGQLVGQVGTLPPERPEVLYVADRIFTLPTARASRLPGSASRVVVVAIRVWQDPLIANIDPSVEIGTAYTGDDRRVKLLFTLFKANKLLAHGNDNALTIIALVVGAASLLLFLLTRRSLYGWVSLNMLIGSLGLPATLLEAHFGMGFLTSIYVSAALDFLGATTYTIFILDALGRRSWKLLGLIVLINFACEWGPLLYLWGDINLTWADGIYFIFSILCNLIVSVYLIKALRERSTTARLLLFPFVLNFGIAAASNLGHFLFDLNVPHASALITGDVKLLTQPFTISLSDVGEVLGTLGILAFLVYRFAQSNREEQRLKSALQTAHDIQQSLVPVDIPLLGGLHTEIIYLAAEEVGGDFCQVLPRPDGSILIVIGDVSGKGLQAAMLGTLAVGALRSMADEDIGPAETMQRLNNVLLRTPNRGFITCLCINLTPSGNVILANAGHLSPYLDGAEIATPPGLPLGLAPGIEYEQISVALSDSARLTLMSDGVVEARSATGELYGFARTSQISHLPASEIAAEAKRFGQEDDITVITLDWRSQTIAVA